MKIAITGDSWSKVWIDEEFVDHSRTIQESNRNNGEMEGMPLMKTLLKYSGHTVNDCCTPGLGNLYSLSKFDRVCKNYKPDLIIHLLTDPVRDHGTTCASHSCSVDDEPRLAEFLESIQSVDHYEKTIESDVVRVLNELQFRADKLDCDVMVIGGNHRINPLLLDKGIHHRITIVCESALNYITGLYYKYLGNLDIIELQYSYHIGFPNWYHLISDKCSKDFVKYVHDYEEFTNNLIYGLHVESMPIKLAMSPDTAHLNPTGMFFLVNKILMEIERLN